MYAFYIKSVTVKFGSFCYPCRESAAFKLAVGQILKAIIYCFFLFSRRFSHNMSPSYRRCSLVKKIRIAPALLQTILTAL